MKKKIITIIIASVLLISLASYLTYLKIKSEPIKEVPVVHKIIKAKKIVPKIIKPKIDYGIHFLNEDSYPYFKKYKASVMPFIKSQYPTNFEVDITIDSVTMDNWKMQIFYSAKITESNYYSYTQKDLNYTCNVRSSIEIPSIASYKKTDSIITGNHYTIPANTSYIPVLINGENHIEFLANGSGYCDTLPNVSNKPIIEQSISNDLYSDGFRSQSAPYIYSIIDSDGVTDNGFINANDASLKYNLKATNILPTNKVINIPKGTVLYYYPSVYSKKIVSTDSNISATASNAILVSKNSYMYLVKVQGQEGWVKLVN